MIVGKKRRERESWWVGGWVLVAVVEEREREVWGRREKGVAGKGKGGKKVDRRCEDSVGENGVVLTAWKNNTVHTCGLL